MIIFAWLVAPMRKIQFCLERRVTTYTSAERVEIMLKLPDIHDWTTSHTTSSSIQKSEIVLENAKFIWEDPALNKLLDSLDFLKKQQTSKQTTSEGVEMKENPSTKTDDYALKGVNLHIKPGSLTLIIGRVGQGKTTFLKSLLGLLPLKEGVFKKSTEESKVSYTS